MASGVYQVTRRRAGAILPLALLAVSPAVAGDLHGRIQNLLAQPSGSGYWAGSEDNRDPEWQLGLRSVSRPGVPPEPAGFGLPLPRDLAEDYNLSLDWGRWSAGAEYSDQGADGLGLEDSWGLSASYRVRDFGLTAGYGQEAFTGEEQLQEWSLGGRYHFGDSALHATFNERQDADDQRRSWALGLQHAFSERARIYSEYQDGDRERGSQVGFGLRYDF